MWHVPPCVSHGKQRSVGLEARLAEHLDAPVKIDYGTRGGKLQVRFKDLDGLERIYAAADRYGEQADRSKRRYASKDDELEALRAECRRLRMERDILKKATAFFAKDQ